MIPKLLRRLLPLLFVAAPVALLAAGYDTDTDFSQPTGDSGAPERRTVGFFARLFNSPAKTNSAEQLAYAQELDSKGYEKAALKAYRSGFLFYQNTPEAPVALLRYAQLLEKRLHYSEAFAEYQYLIDTYAGRFEYLKVVQSQYALANAVETERYGRWFFGIGFVSPERAIPLYFQVVSNAPNWELAPEALMKAGAIYQNNKQYDEAIRTYADLQTRYSRADQASEAAYLMVNCMMSIARRQRNNTQHMLNTLAALRQYETDHPESPYLAQIRANILELKIREAETLMDAALVYERAHKNAAAAEIYRDVAEHFKDTPLAQRAGRKADSLSTPAKEPLP